MNKVVFSICFFLLIFGGIIVAVIATQENDRRHREENLRTYHDEIQGRIDHIINSRGMVILKIRDIKEYSFSQTGESLIKYGELNSDFIGDTLYKTKMSDTLVVKHNGRKLYFQMHKYGVE